MKEIPSWIPKEQWDGYVEMRAAIKKPMKTERAFTLAINTLKKLADEGNDPGSVLDQSVMHSWIGLFAVRVERRGLPRQVESRLGIKGQATANNAHAWLEDSV